jgi:hypothetical protein
MSIKTPGTANRTVVPENAWVGWATGVTTVETEVLQRNVNGAHAVQAVYADGTHIGYVVGRKESVTSKRCWWDYIVGTEIPDPRTFTGMVFGNDSRQHVVSLLTSAAQQQARKDAIEKRDRQRAAAAKASRTGR